VVAEQLRDKITYWLGIDMVMFNSHWSVVAQQLRNKITYHLGIDMVMFNAQWWQNSSGIESHTGWELTWSFQCSVVAE
jgi:hypothetical protein